MPRRFLPSLCGAERSQPHPHLSPEPVRSWRVGTPVVVWGGWAPDLALPPSSLSSALILIPETQCR